MKEDGEISVTVDPNASDFRRVLNSYQWKRTVPIILITTFVLLVFALFVAFGAPNPTPGKILPFFLAAIVLPTFLGTLSVFGIRKHARKLADSSQPTTLTFDSNGIRSVSESSETTIRWSRYDKIVETADDFVIFPQENVFYAVPKRFFDDPAKIDHLRSLLREALGDRLKVKT
jgi:hypothetical protein